MKKEITDEEISDHAHILSELLGISIFKLETVIRATIPWVQKLQNRHQEEE